MATLAVHDAHEALSPPQEPLSPWQACGLILIAPYALVFLLFVLYPVGYGLWLARHPSSYVKLFADPVFPRSVVKTLPFLIFRIKPKMIVALSPSGLFFEGRAWIKWCFASSY